MEKSIILFIAEINKPGGTERVVVNLANSFSAKGWNVIVASINTTSGNAYYPLNDNVELKHLNVKLERNVIKRVTIGFKNTIHAIKSICPKTSSFLMATDPITCYALALTQHKYPQHKFIACEHMGISIAKKYSLWARKLTFSRLDAIVTLTERDRKALINLGVPLNKCFVIPNELSFFPINVADYRSKRLLAIGKLDFQKGFDLLIEIVAKPLSNHNDWVLDIIGQGDLKDRLMGRISELGLSKQIIIHSPTKDIIPCYLQSSIYLMSSRFEGFPMVLLEARACGLPVISYDCPSGPAEIIKDDDGMLIPFNHPKEFAISLEKLMDSEDLRRQMGSLARKDSLNYNSESIYNLWFKLFKQL